MGHLKDCNDRYGTDLCRKLKLRLIGGQHQGRRFSRNLIYTPVFGRYAWDEAQGRKVCKPTTPTIATYNLHTAEDSNFSRRLRRQWRIQATDLFDHWLADTGQWERMIAYVNRCPRIGSKRLALVMLDIDCHRGQSIEEANQTALAIDGALTDALIYWEPSTSGGGLHGYCMISWSASATNAQIREDMEAMGTLLGALTAEMAAGCKEVRGAPMLFMGREIIKCGTWAKIPWPQTRGDAESLVDALEHEVDAADLLQVLTDLTGLRGAAEKAGARAGSGSYSNTVSGAESVLNADEDTYRRASRFCASYLRSFYRAHGRLSASTPNAIVFIDEVHEAMASAQTALFKAVDERAVFVRETYSDTTSKLDLVPFTLIVATTDPQRLLPPLRDRMRLICQLSRYTTEDLKALLGQKAAQLGWQIEESALEQIAQRGMGTPRLALRLLLSARRTARAEGGTTISLLHAERTFGVEEVDALGLGPDEQRYLRILAESNSPVRVKVLATRLGQPMQAVTQVVESNLLWLGLIDRCDAGRALTVRGLEHARVLLERESRISTAVEGN